MIDLIDGPSAGTVAGPAEAAGSNGGKGRMPGGDQADALVDPVWREVRECTPPSWPATIADAAARAARPPMYSI